MLKKIKKKIFPIAKLAFDTYHLKKRKFKYENIEVVIHPEVFPPHFTISTKILLDYLLQLSLKNKSLLELGCGSGIISLLAASKGARVTATDINPTAIELLKDASIQNNLTLDIFHSNLFDKIDDQVFDYIIINPPYYPKNPKNIKEKAWFCGENFEYFKELFLQLPRHLALNTWMILSEDCEISHIKKLAIKNGLSLELILEKSVVGEKNYIFNIQKPT
ncbi:hypothetical protein GCM10009430_40080 [Aquimarina litoralis]|uniref:Methyltransferase small domain-containing protein n=1 Tax=Aquimarina litoralis TaxID=584605 RepID=A0ABP3UBX5_9FLAO